LQLRIDERFRGRWLVSRGFAVLAQIDREERVLRVASFENRLVSAVDRRSGHGEVG
jgi:hypothetical protein